VPGHLQVILIIISKIYNILGLGGLFNSIIYYYAEYSE